MAMFAPTLKMAQNDESTNKKLYSDFAGVWAVPSSFSAAMTGLILL